MIERIPAGIDDPRITELARELVSEMVGIYTGIHDAPQPLDPRIAWVLLSNDDGTPVACGALQPFDKSVPGSPLTIGEVKRVYVRPHHRGSGLGHVVMDELEAWAPDLGYTILRLETGTRQPEALALYRSRGWQPIDKYGPYTHEPTSVCFELNLGPNPDVS